jgi:hypothetical protein
MNLHIKTALVLLTTLIIGFVLGALTVPYFAMHRVRHFAGLRQPRGFVAFFEKIIQPTEAQKDTVHAILTKHFEKFNNLADEHRDTLVQLHKDLIKDLSSILSDEQKQRLADMPGAAPFPFKPFPGGFPGPGPDPGRGPGFGRGPMPDHGPDPGAEHGPGPRPGTRPEMPAEEH